MRGAELGRKALAPRWETAHRVFLLPLVAQEGAGNYSTRPKANGEYARQLLLLDSSSFLSQLLSQQLL